MIVLFICNKQAGIYHVIILFASPGIYKLQLGDVGRPLDFRYLICLIKKYDNLVFWQQKSKNIAKSFETNSSPQVVDGW